MSRSIRNTRNHRSVQLDASFTSPTRSTTLLSNLTSTPTTDTLVPGESYAYLWTFPVIRTYLTWIGIASVILLLLDAAVFIMWLIGRIPGIPSSTMYYGFVLYFLFMVTGTLSLVMSCATEKPMYLITLILVFVSFVLSIFINVLIVRNILDCYEGLLPRTCGNFYLTEIVLLLISVTISIDLFVLLILFAIMVVRIQQSFSTIDSFY